MKIYIYTYQWKILIHLKQFLYLFKNNNANIATKEFYAILDARTKKKNKQQEELEKSKNQNILD